VSFVAYYGHGAGKAKIQDVRPLSDDDFNYFHTARPSTVDEDQQNSVRTDW
jgi:hypothetical protein